MTGSRQLRAWPASDGLVVGDWLRVEDGVADGLGDAPAIDDGWDVAAGGCNATEPQPARSPMSTAATSARMLCQRLCMAAGYAARGRDLGRSGVGEPDCPYSSADGICASHH